MDIATLAQAFATLPDPIKVALGYSLRPMLGDLRAVPAFLARLATRDIESGTIARNEAAKELGKIVAQKAVEGDPGLMEAAKSVLLPGEILRAQNRVGVAAATIAAAARNHAGDKPDKEPHRPQPKSPDEDWFMAFMRFAEDASSDKLRDLFGRILAGEIANPNSISIATLRAAAELDQEIAEHFLWFWHQAIDSSFAPVSIIPGPGSEWARLAELREAGLVSPLDSSVWQPKTGRLGPLGYGWSIGFSAISMTIFFDNLTDREIRRYALTKVGQQLSKILPPPPMRKNLLAFAERYKVNSAVNRISIFADEREEIIWEKPGLFANSAAAAPQSL